jgi:hypothetical protein
MVLLLASAAAAGPEQPRVSRGALAAVERTFDLKIERAELDNPLMLLGATRGVYLPGYGAVFTAELNLITVPVVTPFRPKLSKEEIARVRAKKLERLPLLRRLMEETMVGAAASLDTIPASEQVAVGVSLFYYRSWEDTAGLPSQIILEAQKQKLLDFQARRIKPDALHAAMRVQEL